MPPPAELPSSPWAQAELDPAWVVVRVNPAWTALVGSGPGVRWIDLVHPDDLAAQLANIGPFTAGSEPAFRFPARIRAGPEQWKSCDLVLSAGDAGHIILLALPVRAMPPAPSGIPDDRRELAAALSHDIRQHARLAGAYCSLLARGNLDARQRSLLSVVSDHAERLQQVLTVLVRWLRLADEAPAIGSCDLAAAWAAAVAGLEAEIIPSDLPIIRADQALVTELLRELALNAVRYHPGRVRLQCTAQWKPDYWLVEVADDGAGIPCADRERVLAPLHRLHSWEQVPGHGMGLAIASRIAVRHGGTLTITDAPLGGCMVQVLIPH